MLNRPTPVTAEITLDSAWSIYPRGTSIRVELTWPGRAGWQNGVLGVYENDFGELIMQLWVVQGTCGTVAGPTP